MSNAITTAHALDFEAAPYECILNTSDQIARFRVGTCSGLWEATPYSYDVIAIKNDNPGNGHFEDVLQWFEHSCRRDKKNLRFVEVMNPGLRKHLVTKRGFKHESRDNYIKYWRKMKPYTK